MLSQAFAISHESFAVRRPPRSPAVLAAFCVCAHALPPCRERPTLTHEADWGTEENRGRAERVEARTYGSGEGRYLGLRAALRLLRATLRASQPGGPPTVMRR